MLAIYAQDEWGITELWKIQYGVRGERQNTNNKIYLGPRFSTSYLLTEDVSLKASTGVYYQYLNLLSSDEFSYFDLWMPIDKKMNPARSIDFVLGAETQPWKGYDLNIEVYYKKYKDIVELKDEQTTTTEMRDLFDIGTGRSFGAELFFQKKIGCFTGYIGYTLSWTYRTFPEINGGREFQPKYDRRHDLSVVGNYQLDENWRFGIIYTYATGQAYTTGAGRYAMSTPDLTYDLILSGDRYNRRLEPYHRLDVSVNKKAILFGMKGGWYFQVFNVYNHRNVWYKEFDTSKNPIKVTDVRLLPIIPTFGFNFEF